MITQSTNKERLALTLLLSQAVSYGMVQSFTVIAAYTLFLDRYGAEMLPYGYLLTAASMLLAFYGLAWLQRTMTIPRMLTVVMTGLAVISGLLWFLLQNNSIPWIGFAFLPLASFIVQWGFILPGLQVGRIFDVRQVKRLYPVVNAGVNAGFILGSIGAPILIASTGSLATAMAGAVAILLLTLLLILATVAIFKENFVQPASTGQQKPTKSVGQLLKLRYVRLIVGIQMLTAVIFHITEFMYLYQSEARYPIAEDLAAFLGGFGAARNVTAVLVMALIAGRLINRYGVKFALLSGPLGIAVSVASIIGVGLTAGVDSTALFWLTVVTFGLHVVLEEGFTIPAQKTSYQLLPKDERLATETLVEGMGMAVAVGISGLILLAFNALPELTVVDAAWLALAITGVWIAVSNSLIRSYAQRLLSKLNRRVLDENALTLSDGFDQGMIASFLRSGELGKVRLALNVLQNRYEPSLHNHVLELLEDPKPEIRIEGLNRVEQLQLGAAIPHINRRLTSETKPNVRGAALRALGAVGEAKTTEQLLQHMDAPSAQVQKGALIGLLKYGTVQGKATANQRLMHLAVDTDSDSRSLAAQIIGDAGLPEHDQPLRQLLRDSQASTRYYAFNAAAQLKYTKLLPDLVDNLGKNVAVRSVAARTLHEYGEGLLPLVSRALENSLSSQTGVQSQALSDQSDSETYSGDIICRLIHICGQIKGASVTTLLKQYLNHPESAIQRQVIAALSASGYQAENEADRAQVEQVLSVMLRLAQHTYVSLLDISNGTGSGARLLLSALEQSLVDARQQILYLLSFLYNSRAMRRADEQITYGPPAIRALATEMLDVTLSSRHKNMIWPLISDKMEISKRIQQIDVEKPAEHLPYHERLIHLLGQPNVGNTRWVQTCSIYTVGTDSRALGDYLQKSESIEKFLTSHDPIQRETAEWAAGRLQLPASSGHAILQNPTQHDNARKFVEEAMYLTLEKVALLKEVDIFAETPDHILASVAAIVEQVDLDTAETFIQQGDIGDCMYLIIDGEVSVHQGEDEILTLGPGKSVGELAILDLSPRETSVTTTQPTQLFRIDKDAFDEVLDERPEIARSVIRALSQRVRMTTAARQEKS